MPSFYLAAAIGWALGFAGSWLYFSKAKLLRSRPEWRRATGRARRSPVGYFTTYERELTPEERNGIGGSGENAPSASGPAFAPPIGLHGLSSSAEEEFRVRDLPLNAKKRDSARVWFWAPDGSVEEVVPRKKREEIV